MTFSRGMKDFHRRNGHFLEGKVHFPNRNGDFPAGNARFQRGNGDFPVGNGDFPVGNVRFHPGKVDFQMGNGDFSGGNGRFRTEHGLRTWGFAQKIGKSGIFPREDDDGVVAKAGLGRVGASAERCPTPFINATP